MCCSGLGRREEEHTGGTCQEKRAEAGPTNLHARSRAGEASRNTTHLYCFSLTPSAGARESCSGEVRPARVDDLGVAEHVDQRRFAGGEGALQRGAELVW